MHIVIAHYHLKPGGVTSVILAQTRELTQAGHRITLATSCLATEVNQTPHITVPELAYAVPSANRAQEGAKIANSLASCAPDLIHWHNPLLGKNPATLAAIEQIHRAGIPQLIHCHDFAEDGRPAQLAALRSTQQRTLPAAANIHFATLTPRDQEWLTRCRIPPARIHVVDNPQCPPPPPLMVCAPRISPVHLVMPVRGIRRKNLGEAVLWARELKPTGGSVTLTLPPTSDRDTPDYNAWRAFAQSQQLPFHAPPVGEVKPRPIASIMSEASAVLSTSVQEGHGYALHEPWLYQRAVISRALPNLRPIAPRLCYQRIPVPSHLIDLAALRTELERRTGSRADPIWHHHFAGPLIDYAQLPASAQRELLGRAEFLPHFECLDGARLSATQLIARAQEDPAPVIPPPLRCALPEAMEKCAASPRSPLHWLTSTPLSDDLLTAKHFQMLTT